MDQIQKFADDPDVFIRKLAVLSLVALIKDLIPGYKINVEQLKSESEKQLSKDTMNQRYFETRLLQSYKNYLKYLDVNSKSAESNDLRFVCIKCLGELLGVAAHFNFRSNIIEAVCPVINNPQQKVLFNLADIVSCVLLRMNPFAPCSKMIPLLVKRHWKLLNTLPSIL